MILAFDLSLSNTGFAVGKVVNRKLEIIEVGSIGTKRFAQRSTGFRLDYIAREVNKLYKRYAETEAVVKERSFSNGNITATQQIFKVNGVWEMMTHIADHDFTEITPSQVKKELTGNGRASKDEVKDAVLSHFRTIMGDSSLKFGNKDESDAVAVLITYCKKKGLID